MSTDETAQDPHAEGDGGVTTVDLADEVTVDVGDALRVDADADLAEMAQDGREDGPGASQEPSDGAGEGVRAPDALDPDGEAAAPARRSSAVADGMQSAVLLARMESRLRAIEDALERSLSRQQELERRHGSEVDLIRARLDDTLDVMTDTLQRSRAVQAETQQRVSHLLAASERTTRSYVDDLRAEFAPRVTRTQSQIESMQSRLAGELEAFTEEARSRMAQMEDLLRHAENREDRTQTMLDDQVEELRNFAIRRLMETSQAMQEQRETMLALAEEVRERVATVEHGQATREGLTAERVDELAGRLAATEADLQARVEEARATLSERVDVELAASREATDAARTEVDERLARVQSGVDDDLEAMATRLEDRLERLETEYTTGVGAFRADVMARLDEVEERGDGQRAEVAARLEAVDAALETSLATERQARQEVERRVDERVNELIETTTEVRGLVGSGEVRLRGEIEQLAQRIDAVAGTVDGLQEQVAAAVGTVASRLSNEVATIGGDLDALRDIVRGLETRAAAVDQHRRRLDLLDEQITETSRIARNVNQAVLGAVQRHRERSAETDEVPASHADAVIAGVAEQVDSGDVELEESRG